MVQLCPNYPVGNRCVFGGKHYSGLLVRAVSERSLLSTSSRRRPARTQAHILVSRSKWCHCNFLLLLFLWNSLNSHSKVRTSFKAFPISHHKMFFSEICVVSLAWTALPPFICLANLCVLLRVFKQPLPTKPALALTHPRERPSDPTLLKSEVWMRMT